MTTRIGSRAWGAIGGTFAMAAIGLLVVNFTSLLGTTDQVVERDFDATAVHTLVVRTPSGRITVVTGDVDRITVSGTVTRSIGGAQHTESVTDGVLELRQRCPWYGSRCEADWKVTAPPDVELDLRTGNGRVMVDGSTAPVRVHTSNGPIDMVDVSGTIRASTRNGRLTGTRLGAADVEASSANGPVELTFTSALDRAVLVTRNGPITLDVPDVPGAYRVATSAVNGSEQVSIRTDPAARATIDAHSANGGIRIGYGGS